MIRAQRSLVVSIAAWFAWIAGLLVVPRLMPWGMATVFLATFWLPWLMRALAIGPVAAVANLRGGTFDPAIRKQLIADVLIGIMPLFGMLISTRTWHRGVIGGGSQTINGATSYIPELPVGPISRWLGWSYFIASLCWTSGLGLLLWSQSVG